MIQTLRTSFITVKKDFCIVTHLRPRLRSAWRVWVAMLVLYSQKYCESSRKKNED